MSKEIQKLAVVGAGVSGLSAAAALAKAGRTVQIFEKSRGLGGRLAVRRVEGIGSFDIGAQFMTADSAVFGDFLARAVERGDAAAWNGRIVHLDEDSVKPAFERQRWVGVPGMNAWVSALFPRESIALGHTVSTLEQTPAGGWILDGDGHQIFDAVILAVPSAQARALVPRHALRTGPIDDLLSRETMDPCWCVYAAFETRLTLPFDGAFVRRASSPFSWLGRDSSKPGRRGERDHWVLHASVEWTRAHFDSPASEVENLLLQELAALYGQALPLAAHVGSHRWRFAAPTSSAPQGTHWDPGLGLGVVGDWVNGGRVEGAFLAGLSLAQAIAGPHVLPRRSGRNGEGGVLP